MIHDHICHRFSFNTWTICIIDGKYSFFHMAIIGHICHRFLSILGWDVSLSCHRFHPILSHVDFFVSYNPTNGIFHHIVIDTLRNLVPSCTFGVTSVYLFIYSHSLALWLQNEPFALILGSSSTSSHSWIYLKSCNHVSTILSSLSFSFNCNCIIGNWSYIISSMEKKEGHVNYIGKGGF